jgi:hypothetical protein
MTSESQLGILCHKQKQWKTIMIMENSMRSCVDQRHLATSPSPNIPRKRKVCCQAHA